MSTEATIAGAERIAGAFAGSGKRAALMPYLMGGFPDVAAARAIGAAYADGGADLVEFGVPVLRPDRRRARDPGRGDARRFARAQPSTVCSRSARLSPRGCRWSS